eukprot:jgi/Tetstr1/426484/TSEL_016785.t1
MHLVSDRLLLRDRRSSCADADSSEVCEPATLLVGDRCPLELRKGEGASWSAKDFRIKRQLSASKTCGVYLAEAVASQTLVVLKIQSKERLSCMNRHQVAREVHVHAKMDHENILDLYGVFEDQYSLVMILEYASQGDVLKKLTSSLKGMLTETDAKSIVRSLLKSLVYVHEQGIIHRDIKPENILITRKGDVKLTDFGVCIDMRKERPVSAVGTLDYMSPEVTKCPLKSAPSDNKHDGSIVYGFGSDIWAVGVLAFELVTGLPPFSAESSTETKVRIATEGLRMPRNFSPALKNFVQMCTEKRANRRPSAEALLKHPWLAESVTPAPSKVGLLKKAFSGKALKPTMTSMADPSAQSLSTKLSGLPQHVVTFSEALPPGALKVTDSLTTARSLPPLSGNTPAVPPAESPAVISPAGRVFSKSKSSKMIRNVKPETDNAMRGIGQALSTVSRMEYGRSYALFSDSSAPLRALKTAGLRLSCA